MAEEWFQGRVATEAEDRALERGVSWGDWGRTVGIGMADFDKMVMSGARALSELQGDTAAADRFVAASRLAEMDREDRTEGMSEIARRRLLAGVTSEEFLSAPVSSTVLKMFRMSPMLAASVIPAGLPGVSGLVGVAAMGGALSAADVIDGIYDEVDAASDKDLRLAAPFYDELRNMGMSEGDARQKYTSTIRGYKPVIAYAIGAATNAAGFAGQVSRISRGGSAALAGASRGPLTRAALATGEAAVSGGIDEGQVDYLTQTAAIEGGLQGEFDTRRLMDATLEGALLEGVFGAGAGAASRAPNSKVEMVEPKAPDTAERIALEGSLPPAMHEAVAETTLAPSHPETMSEDTTSRITAPELPSQVTPEVTSDAAQDVTQDITQDTTQEIVPEPDPSTLAGVTPDGRRILRPVGQEQLATPLGQPQRVVKEKGAIGSKDTKKLAKRSADAIVVEKIFDELVPPVAEIKVPKGDAERTALLQRIEGILTRLEEAGVKIPAKVGYAESKNPTPDHLIWAREVTDMAKTLRKKQFKLKEIEARDAHITSFLMREAAARGGDFAPMRSERLLEGEMAKRGGALGSKNVDTIAAPVNVAEQATTDDAALAASQTALDKGDAASVAPEFLVESDDDAVQTSVTKSAKGGARGLWDESQVGRDPGKRMPITDEIRAKYESKHEKQVNKPADVTLQSNKNDKSGKKPTITPAVQALIDKANARAASARKDDVTTSRKPVLTPKVAEMVARAKAREEARGDTAQPTASHADVTLQSNTPKKVVLTPKVAEIVERVAAAAKRVNTTPTEAQKESGTYAKGHVSISGLPVTIENPLGSKRSGKGRDGETWETTMPAHYGYVKRSKGADGDQVDVYVGPNPVSKHVFVIDQLDVETGKFDEHKAMLGYNDPVLAMQDYENSFSDGKGFERIGKITTMSMDDFKLWLNRGDTTVEAAALEANKDLILPSGVVLPSGVKVQAGAKNKKKIINFYTASENTRTVRVGDETAIAESRSTFKDAFHHWVGEDTGGGLVYQFLGKRVRELAADVPVYVVSHADMRRLTAAYPHANDPLAFQHTDANGKPMIAVSRNLIERASLDKIRLVLIHEGDHAITAEALRDNPRLWAAAESIRALLISNHTQRNEALGINEKTPYGVTDVFELLAEARSNPEFQRLLADTPLTAEQETAFKSFLPAPTHKKIKNLWDAFIETVRNALRLPDLPHSFTALEAVFRLQERAEGWHVDNKSKPKSTKHEVHAITTEALKGYADDIKTTVTGAAQQAQQSAPKLLKIMSMSQIAESAERYFPAGLVQKYYNLREMRRVRASKILHENAPLIERHVELERKYSQVKSRLNDTGTVWDDYSRLVHDETNAGVFADRTLEENTHLGKDTMSGAWSKAQHAELHRLWKSLPAELKTLRSEAMTYYTAQQNQMSLDIIKNRVLLALGVDDASLAQRIFDETFTAADIEKVGGKRVMDLILQASALKKIEGPYFPLMRHGGYVVQGFYKIEPPKTGMLVAGTENVFEFRNRDAALDYAKEQPARPMVRSIWVDKNTGLTYGTDDDGKQVRITSQDVDAEQRWRVTVQDKHVEFFESLKEARQAAQELEKPGDGSPSAFRLVKGVEEKRYQPSDFHTDMLSSDVRHLKDAIEKSKSYREFTPQQKKELEMALSEASIRMMGSTRIQSRRLPRRYVAGASKDTTRVLADYAQSVSGYIAKLEFAPRIERAHKDIWAAVGDDATKESSLGRSAIANEIDRRIAQDEVFQYGVVNEAAQRLMTASFADKLASPSYSIINATQPILVAVPVLAGRHRVGAVVTEMTKAYNDVAGFSIVKQGLRATAQAAQGADAEVTYLADVKRRLKDAGERQLIDILEERGTIDADAGLEIVELRRKRAGSTVTSQVMARADKALGYIEGLTRQMPRAIEVINRTTTALAAYRLEMHRTGSHEKAVEYAQKVVDLSQFNYSNTSAAPIFNHPLAKLSLQFKKYGQAMYYLIGSNVGKAWRGGTHGERAEALRTLGMIAVTHTAMAGALGLPTEPFKYLLMGAKMAGLTATGWDDVEEIVRDYAASALGKEGGEIFSKGLPRALGIDLSSRVGLDSLMTFGEPRTDKEADVKKWLWDTIAGAPAGLVTDYIYGANALMSGEFTKAAELMLPLKVGADSIKAYRIMTEGKKSQQTGRQIFDPYSPLEAGVRALGFTPAREAEEGAKVAAFKRQSTKAQDARSELINLWINAKGADKVSAQRAVQDYNRTVAQELKITQDDLMKAAKRRAKQGTGLITTKRTEPIARRLERVYGAQ